MHLLRSKNLALLGDITRGIIFQKTLKLEKILEVLPVLVTEIVIHTTINNPHGGGFVSALQLIEQRKKMYFIVLATLLDMILGAVCLSHTLISSVHPS